MDRPYSNLYWCWHDSHDLTNSHLQFGKLLASYEKKMKSFSHRQTIFCSEMVILLSWVSLRKLEQIKIQHIFDFKNFGVNFVGPYWIIHGTTLKKKKTTQFVCKKLCFWVKKIFISIQSWITLTRTYGFYWNYTVL